jgi:hypothetical protein
MAEEKEKGLETHTIAFMIGTALFFDFLQFLLDFILMGWLVSIFAGLTFWFWFRQHGIKFNKASRWGSFAFTYLVELIPVIGDLPAWTAEVAFIALSSKAKEVVEKKAPGVSTALGAAEGKVLGFKARQRRRQASQESESTERYEEAA